MFIGHAAVALAAKPLAPRVNLAWYLLAAYWLDVVWPVLLLAKVEQVLIAPGNTAFTPLNFVYYPWTHSLAAAIVWSVAFSLVFLKKGKREALILGLLVFSHWLLDFVTHRPDLPLWPGSTTKVGLGLWNSVPGTLVVEGALFATAVWLYARRTPSRDRIGTWAFWGLIAFLSLAYLANAFGPPPPGINAIAIAGIAGAALFTAWAWWADRHRGPQQAGGGISISRRHVVIAAAGLLLAGAAAWTILRGLPLAAEYVARQTPAKVEAEIGAQALAALEGKACAPGSKLPVRLQGALQREFARLTTDLGDGRAYRLVLRSCEGLGPNALGLPGGTILATDELVALGRNMQEVAAILAHEVGHVRQRHGLRTLLRNAGAFALARALLQDAGAIDGLGAQLPAMLLASGYAPAFEDEADAYALQRLRQLGISSRAYADILDRIATRRAAPGATQGGAKGAPQVADGPRDYLTAHPLESRIVRALAAETEVDRCTYSASVAFERLEACNRAIDQGKGTGAELASAHAMRGQLLNARGTQERAIEDLGRALSLGSRDPQAYNALAWILATSPEDRLRDGARAKQLALVACELSGWKDAAIIDTLAAAHAERAEFGEAVRRQKEALGFAEFDQRQGGPARERLALYESGKPYREVPR